MTVEEIFSKLSAHMIEGLMAHGQFATSYQFLGLDGYKRCHEYHFLSETLSYRKIQRYYICKYNKLIPEERTKDPNTIPESWYKYTRQAIDNNSKRMAIKSIVDKWYEWEVDTYKLYKEFYKELEALEEYDAAKQIECLMCDIEEEIKDIEKKQLKLKDIDYSLTYILQCQSHLHKKYKKKMKELL